MTIILLRDALGQYANHLLLDLAFIQIHTHMTIYKNVINSMYTRSAWRANQSSVHLLYDHLARGSTMAKLEQHSHAMYKNVQSLHYTNIPPLCRWIQPTRTSSAGSALSAALLTLYSPTSSCTWSSSTSWAELRWPFVDSRHVFFYNFLHLFKHCFPQLLHFWKKS